MEAAIDFDFGTKTRVRCCEILLGKWERECSIWLV
jgi:hypothetical protein